MSHYTTKELPHSGLISCVIFSCWDNTAGPTPKCVWECTPRFDASEIKLLTRLVLKTEVTRDPTAADIDCNVHTLPEMSVCSISYVFSGYAKSRIGSRIYCLIFVYKLEQRAHYMRWSSILDPAIKQGLAEYRVKLHQVILHYYG